jgi:hypothetical protein
MKEQSNTSFTGFSMNYKADFRKFRDFYSRSSTLSTSLSQIGARSRQTASHSNLSFENSSFNKLIDSSETPVYIEFYSKAKEDFRAIESHFNNIRDLGKRAKKATFGDHDKINSQISQIMTTVSKKIYDTEVMIKESGMLSSIDRSAVVKALISSIQSQLYFNLSKLKGTFKQLNNDLSSKQSHSRTSDRLNKSKFDFIVEEEENKIQTTFIYDKHGNSIQMAEINAFEQESPYYEHIHKSIHMVSKTIAELDEISMHQGAMVDRIDMNIFNSLESTKKANKELFIAREELRKDWGDKLIRVLLIINLMIFLLLLFKMKNF